MAMISELFWAKAQSQKNASLQLPDMLQLPLLGSQFESLHRMQDVSQL
jgi:hypothetical protein